MNCPADKNIEAHFKDQLSQLRLKPRTREEHLELMLILNTYLCYPDEGLA